MSTSQNNIARQMNATQRKGHGSLSTVFREQFAAAIPPKNEWILNSAVNCWLIKRQHV